MNKIIELIIALLGRKKEPESLRVVELEINAEAVNEPKAPDNLITKDQLKQALPQAKDQYIDYYYEALCAGFVEHEINTPLRIAHFVSQLAHESANFSRNEENLNYGEAALRAVFGKYFTTDQMAKACERKPKLIANIAYGGRMGNNCENDGFKFRGRGLIQLTGKDNYSACSEALCINLVANPELINDDPFTCIAVACWFWNSRKLSKYADADNVKSVTKKINGGYNGLEHRKKLLESCKKAFNVSN